MNARTGELPWDLSGRAKTPEEYKAWVEERKRRSMEKKKEQEAESIIDRIPDPLMAVICTGILLLWATGEIMLIRWVMS